MREMFVPQQFCAFRNMFFVAQVIDAMLDLGWSEDTKKLDHVKLTRLKLDMIKNFTTAFRKVPYVLGQIWDAIEQAAAKGAHDAQPDSTLKGPELKQWIEEGSEKSTRPQDDNIPTFGGGRTWTHFDEFYDFKAREVRSENSFSSFRNSFVCSETVFPFFHEIVRSRTVFFVPERLFFVALSSVRLFAGQVQSAGVRQQHAGAVRDAVHHDFHAARPPNRGLVRGTGGHRAGGPA